MLCHNTDRIVGHITDNFIELQEKHRKIFEELLPVKCKTCEHLDICRCICPIAVQKMVNYVIVIICESFGEQ